MLKAFSEFDQQLDKADISMTPLVDMVFILLIFFVVTTTFTKETGIKINKAKASTSQVINKNLLTVAIDVPGNYWHDNGMHSLSEITSVIIAEHENNEELNIVIIPDKNGKVEPLISLMDKLRTKNITRFSLGTQLTNSD